jgi:hypothetical protein
MREGPGIKVFLPQHVDMNDVKKRFLAALQRQNVVVEDEKKKAPIRSVQ